MLWVSSRDYDMFTSSRDAESRDENEKSSNLRTTVNPSSASSRASLTVYILTAAFEIASTQERENGIQFELSFVRKIGKSKVNSQALAAGD